MGLLPFDAVRSGAAEVTSRPPGTRGAQLNQVAVPERGLFGQTGASCAGLMFVPSSLCCCAAAGWMQLHCTLLPAVFHKYHSMPSRFVATREAQMC